MTKAQIIKNYKDYFGIGNYGLAQGDWTTIDWGTQLIASAFLIQQKKKKKLKKKLNKDSSLKYTGAKT